MYRNGNGDNLRGAAALLLVALQLGVTAGCEGTSTTISAGHGDKRLELRIDKRSTMKCPSCGASLVVGQKDENQPVSNTR